MNFPKKTNNPNPSPIGNKFGLFLFGPSGENRTHGLLNPIQARYQNCATPGYLFAFAAHSLISIPDFSRFVKRFFQISYAVFTFCFPGFARRRDARKSVIFKNRYTHLPRHPRRSGWCRPAVCQTLPWQRPARTRCLPRHGAVPVRRRQRSCRW